MVDTTRTQYEKLGFTEPVNALSDIECRRFLHQATDYLNTKPPLEWPKSLAAESKIFYDLATHPSIVERVSALIGDDIILWASSLVIRPPNFNHPWHSDIESSIPPEKTCTVWVALNNVNRNTSLRLIPYSHKFDVTVQEMNHKNGLQRGQANTETILQWAKQKNSLCYLHQTNIKDGDIQLFDGHIWHHSNNTTAETRHAAILQYAVPQAKMRRTNMRNGLNWPLEQLDTPKPACLSIKGNIDATINRFVPAPTD